MRMSDMRIYTMRIRDLAKEIRRINHEHGWDSAVSVVSELSEALGEFPNREPINLIYYKTSGSDKGVGFIERHEDTARFNEDPANNKPEGLPIEIADVVIRILDFCEANDIDLELALNLKLAYNETRAFRHGGKLV